MHATMNRHDRLALVILAVTQSLLLLLLHKALEHEFWPATDLRWLFGCYTVALGLPAFLYLAAERLDDRWNGIAAGILAVALFVIGFHAGWLLEGPDDTRTMNPFQVISPMVLSVGIGLFLLALYFRSWRQAPGQALSYARLLENSWLNALTAGFLALFIGVFWMLLMLWALLFDVIGVEFFQDLFAEPEFIYPVTGLVGGFGLVMIRARASFIATVRRLCETLIRALLPLVAVIGLLFLAFLPFTGVGTLWEEGPGSPLLVSLLAVTLFFFNAELGDDDGGYPAALRWLVLAAIIVLPLHSLLAGWGLAVRVDEYGWTVARLWALFIELFLAAWAFGYAVFIVLERGLPLARIRRWNVYLGLALGVMLLVVQGPVIDFRRITANDQADRLLDGETPAETFDARYLRFELGRYGINTLEALLEEPALADNPDAKRRIREALEAENYWSAPGPRSAHEKAPTFARPDGAPPLPDGIIQWLENNERWFLEPCRQEDSACDALPFDYRGQTLWVIANTRSGHVTTRRLFGQVDGTWKPVGNVDAQRVVGVPDDTPTADIEKIEGEWPAFRHNGWLYLIHPDLDYLQAIGVLPEK